MHGCRGVYLSSNVKLVGLAVIGSPSFGGFLGIGEEEHAIPWNKLEYDFARRLSN
jgi:hypothetical protein